MRNKTRRIALLGVLTSVALVLSYLEVMLPPISTAVPGIKMGLPNIIIIFVLYKFGLKEAVTVSLIRVFIVALLFGNVMTLAYSVAGAVLSLALMTLFKKINLFSIVGVSIIGGISHNLGQILVAIFLFDTIQIGYYMIVLSITGTIAGVVIGIISSILVKKLEKVV
ncbi:MAG: Gx transporter family protein [Ruminococcaceae bacterium]|nr:Gx transporter family protein [Oscillospiraceae bacterium]